jgi:hypothetical protein
VSCAHSYLLSSPLHIDVCESHQHRRESGWGAPTRCSHKKAYLSRK